MTSLAHRYADFSSYTSDGQSNESISIERVEDQKLQSFEEGYQAGWTDADKNHTAEQQGICEDFVTELRSLSFTYQEALQHLNQGLEPMFEQIMKKLLPQTVDAAFRAHVIEQLVELAATQTQAQIILSAPEATMPVLEAMLKDADLNASISLTADPSLSAQQLFLSLDTLEREINLDAVGQEIVSAMSAFNFHTKQEDTHV
ncbi:MAG: hypothetical protein WBG95_16845 [Sulfitobacter sp.]